MKRTVMWRQASRGYRLLSPICGSLLDAKHRHLPECPLELAVLAYKRGLLFAASGPYGGF
jgi:hypothetical protein